MIKKIFKYIDKYMGRDSKIGKWRLFRSLEVPPPGEEKAFYKERRRAEEEKKKIKERVMQSTYSNESLLKRIKISFRRSLKGEEKLSTVFWGWVVAGNLVWIASLKLINYENISKFHGFFTVPVCKYFSTYSVKIQTSCFFVSMTLFLLMFIFYPLTSQVMLFKSSNNTRKFYIRTMAKIFSILIIMGLFIIFGYFNFFIMILAAGH